MATSAAEARPAWRIPLMGVALLSLAGGLWGGLARLGGAWPLPDPDLVLGHGPLMVCGFLGTLISLERAVALRQAWAYGVPVLVGAGGVLLLAGLAPAAGALLVTAGSVGLLAAYVVLLRMQPERFLQVMTLGAGLWLAGNVYWLTGAALFEVVPWWLGFLVLTIAGERLELSRMLQHPPRIERLFLGIALLLTLAITATLGFPDAGWRLAGVALLAMGLWLARYDIARYTVKHTGLTRFIAVCLLAGYAWLGVAGVLAMGYGAVAAGPVYDALLHAVFVGFVFSMIFGHAPIIFPAVLGVTPFYRPVLYAPLVLLHASLLLRFAGDLAGGLTLRRSGGILNAAAILLYLLSVGYAMLAERRATPALHT